MCIVHGFFGCTILCRVLLIINVLGLNSLCMIVHDCAWKEADAQLFWRIVWREYRGLGFMGDGAAIGKVYAAKFVPMRVN